MKIIFQILLIIGVVVICPEVSFSNTEVRIDSEKVNILPEIWYFIPDDQPSYKNDTTDLSKWDKIQINKSWKTYKNYSEYNGIAWYRLDFYVDKKLENYSILLPLQNASCEIFFNGNLIYQTLPPNKKGQFININGKPDLITIPDNLIKIGKNSITIRQGCLHQDSGFDGLLTFGPYLTLHRMWLYNVIWYSSIACISFFIAMHYIIIFLNRKTEKYYLYFSILGLSLGLWILGYKGYILWIFNYQAVYILSTYIGAICTAITTILFIRSFLNYPGNIIVRLFIIFYCLLIFFLITELLLTGGISFYIKYLHNLFFLSILLFNPFALFLCIYAIAKKRPYAKLISIGFLFILVTSALSVLKFLKIIDIQPFIMEGFFIQNLVFAAVLASRYAQVHTDLEEAHSDLLVLDKMKDDFLATTSHELRTPLHGIMGLTEALADGSLGEVNERQAESLSLINRSASHLNGLVNEILDFSKLSAGKADLFIREISLGDVLQTVVSLVRASARDKDIEFFTDIPALPRIQADPDRLRQVLINILGNAVKFTDRGSITVRARSEAGGRVSIAVTDTGIGIDPEHIHRIFNPFEQAADPDTRRAGGAGLGLAIAKRLVELHGGSISAESRKGEGSTFTITLAAVPPAAGIRMEQAPVKTASAVLQGSLMTPAAAREVLELDLAGTADATILAVDDDPVNLEVLAAVCGRAGYGIITALDGPAALKIIEDREVDLVLLDLMLPGMSGFEVCQKIRGMRTERYVPVIMVTARDQVSDLVRSFKTGANDYITKPFNRNELLLRMENQLAIKYMLDMERTLLNGLRKEKETMTDLFHRSATLKESARQMSEWERIIKEDLNIAHQFQLKLMTHRKDIPWIDSSVRYRPLLRIGGDIYDVFEQRPGVTRVFLGDATGHGINASLNTVKILSEYAAVKEVLEGPAEVVKYMNQRFVQYFKDYQIVFSCIAADIDRASGTVRIAMAGHPEQYIISGDGVVPVKLRGPIVGLAADIQYEEASFPFAPGDALVLFTDGIFEFFPPGNTVFLNQQLSTTGMFDGIKNRGSNSMKAGEMTDMILQFGEGIGSRDPIDDDITLFVLKRLS